MPLIDDFLVRMRDSHPWLVERDRKSEADAVQEVLTFRLNAASAAYWTHLDLENIEELFSLASSTRGALADHVQLAIAATLDYSQSTAIRQPFGMKIEGPSWVANAKWLEVRPNDPRQHVDPYVHHIAKLLGMFRTGKITGHNTFVSFNYDTIVEDALTKLGVPFSYCFEKQSVDYDGTAQVTTEENAKVKVLKLHGSVNWGRKKKRGRTLVVFDKYSDLLAAQALPELVPPTWKKIFQNQLGHIWLKAVTALHSATRVIIIGFSIPPTDTHFKYLLASGLQQNVSLRQMCFFNPTINEVATRAKALLRQQYIDLGLISFYNNSLGELCRDGKALQKIGRPFWKPGDVGTISVNT
ncbi:MAG TPA: SIR2 family protein [Candidatus Acidoferrum sp.]|nr:SIR2 family protein [Candidatus Acidoferrum sp.]